MPYDAPDPSRPALGPTFQFTSLTREQRRAIVDRTADHNDPAVAPVHADLLMLTALGASLDLEGAWAVSTANGLQQWRHVTVGGRDHYVRVVERGYLFPVGHRAVQVTLVERVFTVDSNAKMSAYLQRKIFLRVTQPVKTYPAGEGRPNDTPGQPFEGRAWPLASVRIATEESPPVETLDALLAGDDQAGFPIRAGGGDVRWELVATDAVGNRLSFSVPLVFVKATGGHSPYDEGYAHDLARRYNEEVSPARRTGDPGGARLRYAAEADQPGATTHPTMRITLAAATTRTDPNTTATAPAIDRARLEAADQPAFYPSLGAARPRLPAADALTKATNDLDVKPYHDYVFRGLVNAGKVYAAAVEPKPLRFAGEAVGAVATPNFAVTALSASVGPVGGSVDGYAEDARVNPADYFGGVAEEVLGRLLGGLKLTEVIGPMPAPTIVEVLEKEVPAGSPVLAGGPAIDVVRRIIRYHLEAPLQPIENVFEPAEGGQLVMDAVAIFPAAGPPSYEVDGRIDAFKIKVLGGGGPLHFIDIPFNGVRFRSKDGAKPDIDVDIGDVAFAGALTFVNQLAAFLKGLSAAGLSPNAGSAAVAGGPAAAPQGQGPGPEGSGPFVSVSSTGVDAGTSLAVPAIVVGVFNLQDLALTVGVHVPFTGAPTVARFAFASREHPFSLTVMAFGGQGFIGLGVGLERVELVEASLAFGAQVALDIGVASGGVTVAGGVYFKFEAGKGLELTGFLRITGALEVLGLIAISAEFNLALTYRPKSDSRRQQSLGGTATLRVEIDIAFFSVTKDLTVTRELAGADPTFQDMVPDLATWQAYCAAFAG